MAAQEGVAQARYSVAAMKKIIKVVAEDYGKGDFTIDSCCTKAGVAYSTFRGWIQNVDKYGKDELLPQYKKWSQLVEVVSFMREAENSAENFRNEELVRVAESSLMKRVKGFEYEEVTTEVKQVGSGEGAVMVPVGMKKTKKFIPPSDSAIQFVLKNHKSETYGEKLLVGTVDLNTNEHKGKSLAQLNQELVDVQKRLGMVQALEEYAEDTEFEDIAPDDDESSKASE